MKKETLIIARHYGLEHQLEKQLEELEELHEATRFLLKITRSASFATPTGQQALTHYCEEVADVNIMIDQNNFLLGGDTLKQIDAWRKFKVARQLRRIADEIERETIK